MIWTGCLVRNGQILPDEVIREYRFFPASEPTDAATKTLLVRVEGRELGELDMSWYAFHSLHLTRTWLDETTKQGYGNILAPARDLDEAEQALLQEWLIGISWEAWARASHEVRALAGAPEPPLSLQQAADVSGYGYMTLVKAADTGRLPVITVADRRFVYAQTIEEAHDRKLMGHFGRPKSKKE